MVRHMDSRFRGVKKDQDLDDAVSASGAKHSSPLRGRCHSELPPRGPRDCFAFGSQ